MKSFDTFYTWGSGWISGTGYGCFGSTPGFSRGVEEFNLPELRDYINDLPARFGRFDLYTRVAFATAVLALKDAGLLQREEQKNVGIIIGSSTGVYDNDLAYFVSTGEAQGEFSSPNLFSYTLPNVALGEIAVFFKMVGPTFCVGNDPVHPGLSAISAAQSLLKAKQCTAVLAGWVEVASNIKNSEAFPKGAALSLLTLERTGQAKAGFALDSDLCFLELFGGNQCRDC
jgi:3-oxoacyl-(acyl-carrier-protein) synthase